MSETVVITDTSVLINFLVLDRAGLLARLSTHRFVVTHHVRAEITTHYHEQLQRLEQAFRLSLNRLCCFLPPTHTPRQPPWPSSA